MRIIFTKSDSIMSKMIMGATGEPCSHCAIQYGPVIIHSNLWGVHIEWAALFFQKAEIVAEIPLLPEQENLTKLHLLLMQTNHSYYDVGALLYLGLKFSLRNLFKISLPQVNLWQDKHLFLCTELVSKFWFGQANSLVAPYELYNMIREDYERTARQNRE